MGLIGLTWLGLSWVETGLIGLVWLLAWLGLAWLGLYLPPAHTRVVDDSYKQCTLLHEYLAAAFAVL